MMMKRSLQVLFQLIALPRLMRYHVARLLIGSAAFGAASESIGRAAGLWGVYLRQAFYRRTLRTTGQDCYFGWMSVFSMIEASVGNKVYVGRFCTIGFADIGDQVMLADGVQILSGGREHGRFDRDQAMQAQAQSYHQVQIGRGAWIGAGAIVMADVGEGSIVGAGAVVNRPIPARCVAVGVPARIVKRLDDRREDTTDRKWAVDTQDHGPTEQTLGGD